ncbi:MAG: ABC transporter permease [Armatimonadota bacterium]|nr:ABC transporter permease [Armatimonadota bacterium]MDR7464726.1 ABC transporter permease [Armatimonadota bacterium]MDR7469788.1 ABC transporter permease [Armatimonadota bacterium]MDR7474687.1 ABC transporter permease [Armatimonadota bacterium]MDR7539446.1 ABC transporter permease [Armatimonadota bacterium]
MRRTGIPAVAAVRAAQAAIVGGLLVGWEVGVRRGWLSAEFLSRPTAVGAVLVEWIRSGFLWPHLAATLQAAIAGLALGLVLGAALGFLAMFVPAVGEMIEPAMSTLNAVPRVVFYPLLVLWLGLGMASKVGLVVTIVAFVGYFTTVGAVREVDRLLLAQVRILGASPGATLRHLYLPATLAWMVTSLRTSVGLAFIGAILGEYLGSMRGMGNIIMGAQNLFQTPQVMAGLVLTLGLAGAVDTILAHLEGRWSAWRRAPQT